MKRYSKWIILTSVMVLLLNVMPNIAKAQPGDPGDPNEDPDAPLDGGVVLLLAVGVGYGVKVANDRRKARTKVLENI